MQNYNGSKTGVPPFTSNTSSLISQVQALIANMMNNPASNDSTTLANLENLATQESAAWAAYVASDTTTTTSNPLLFIFLFVRILRNTIQRGWW